MENHLSRHSADELKAPVATLCPGLTTRSLRRRPRGSLRAPSFCALTYRELGARSRPSPAPLRDGAPGEDVARSSQLDCNSRSAYSPRLKALAAPLLPQPSLNPTRPAPARAPAAGAKRGRAIIFAPRRGNGGRFLPASWRNSRVVFSGQTYSPAAGRRRPSQRVVLRAASPADPAALLFSGGTTGLPQDSRAHAWSAS